MKIIPNYETCQWLCLDLISCGIYPLDCPYSKNMSQCNEYSVSDYARLKWKCNSATIKEIEEFKKNNPEIQIG